MSLLPQSQIPTIAVLYATGKLLPSTSQVLSPPSAPSQNKVVGLIRADITTLELENGAIVNAANKRLLGGGGIDGAIHRAAGPDLLNECRTLGGARTGESRITRAYNLPCKAIIHTVGPIYSMEQKAEELLASCYQNSLMLAVDNGLSSIAFPAVSTGIYGYPSREAAHTACRTVRKFLDTEAGKKLDLVIFCNFEKKDEDAYHQIVPLYFPPDEMLETSEAPQTVEAEAAAPQDETEKGESVASGEVKVGAGEGESAKA